MTAVFSLDSGNAFIKQKQVQIQLSAVPMERKITDLG